MRSVQHWEKKFHELEVLEPSDFRSVFDSLEQKDINEPNIQDINNLSLAISTRQCTEIIFGWTGHHNTSKLRATKWVLKLQKLLRPDNTTLINSVSYTHLDVYKRQVIMEII